VRVDILIVSHGQCNNAATVGRKRDGDKYPKTWDSKRVLSGALLQSISKRHTSYSSRACMSFHFGINGRSRSRLLVQRSYSIVDIHLAPMSQSGQSSHFLLKWEDWNPAYSIIITSMCCLTSRFLHHALISHIDR
jgi:hypothetical protein